MPATKYCMIVRWCMRSRCNGDGNRTRRWCWWNGMIWLNGWYGLIWTKINSNAFHLPICRNNVIITFVHRQSFFIIAIIIIIIFNNNIPAIQPSVQLYRLESLQPGQQHLYRQITSHRYYHHLRVRQRPRRHRKKGSQCETVERNNEKRT